MARVSRLWGISLLLVLLVPGSALAGGQFIFQGPTTPVYVGQTFSVSVFLTVNSGPTALVNAYQYCADYDQTFVQMVPLDVLCTYTPTDPACDPPLAICIALPPVDAGFFSNVSPYPGYRDCDDKCTAPYYPTAKNCCIGCTPPATCDPANIFFADSGGITCNDQGVCACPCAHTVSFGPTLVSTYTFQAIKAGCFQLFEQNAVYVSQVVDCDRITTDEMTIVNDPEQFCILEKPPVPAFSSYGMALFALVIAGSFIVIMRKKRGAERSKA